MSERDSSTRKVVRRDFDFHPVANKDANAEAPHVAGERRENGMSVVQRYAERRAREDFRNHTLELDRFLFCHSFPVLASVAARARAALRCGRLELPHNAGFT